MINKENRFVEGETMGRQPVAEKNNFEGNYGRNWKMIFQNNTTSRKKLFTSFGEFKKNRKKNEKKEKGKIR